MNGTRHSRTNWTKHVRHEWGNTFRQWQNKRGKPFVQFGMRVNLFQQANWREKRMKNDPDLGISKWLITTKLKSQKDGKLIIYLSFECCLFSIALGRK